MSKLFRFVPVIALLVYIVHVQTGCANIIPPGGGPKDTLPPKLVMALPKDSSINVNTKLITLTFDEFVDVKDVQSNLIVSPVPKNLPIVDYKLRNVTIKLKDSLEPNTTYSFYFGSAIKDVNEGNIAKNFVYIFSTGKTIDNNKFSGKVVLAETGKIDSSLVVVLHNNLNDTSIVKNRPRYYTKLDGKGNFSFRNLPEGKFAAYVVPDDYAKRYDDSTKLFAFLDSTISINKTTGDVTFYAYEEQKRKVAAPATNTNAATQSKLPKGVKEDKRLRISVDLENGTQDVLKPSLQLTFTRKLKIVDTTKIILTDTSYHQLKNYQVNLDSTKTKVIITYNWKTETDLRLLIAKDAVMDTTETMLTKGDTLKFKTKKEQEYGSVRLRFINTDLTKNPVLLFVQGDKIVESIPITGKQLFRKIYRPGDYELRILYDRNKNGVWDTGNYKKKLQPEIVKTIKKRLTVRADNDNEMNDIPL